MARRGRRVRRVVRRIDPWSVLKVSVFFYLSVVIVLLTGAVILWSVAQSSGAVGKIEKFMKEVGFDEFRFQGDQIFRLAIFGGGAFVIAGTVFSTIMAFLYNLISDLVGGIEVSVIEEEAVVADMDSSRRGGRPAKRRPAKRQSGPAPPQRSGPPGGLPQGPAKPAHQPQPQMTRRTVV